ncbi:MAG: chromosomal replication initiator protein DnaA [Deltaproteobacteria bacterium]|nr:chromosomal replication initiator protein DnaA [Deltaproteobacteria bacterium]
MDKSGMQTLFPAEEGLSLSGATDLQGGWAEDPWQAIQRKLRMTLDEDAYISWVKPIKGSSNAAGDVVLTLPNLVFYQGFRNECLYLIERCKESLGLEHIRLHIEVEGGIKSGSGSEAIEGSHYGVTNNSGPAGGDFGPDESSLDGLEAVGEGSQAFSRSLSPEGHLNPNYTFESFIKGDSNQFAVATCLSAAENPGKAYNPLFIYGGVGLGKTHLLHAVGNLVLRHTPNAVVTYISSERFMNELIYCLRFNKMWDFRKKYRDCDVLLVDDIQFISGKKATQEEFFHTFNTLYGAKKQIVITSDMFPKDIPDIEDRLRNRFQWGLIADIQAPSIEHRIAILYSKAEKLGIRLRPEVAEYIAKHAKRNVRELEGALHRINAYGKLQGEEITLDLAARTFKDVLGEAPKRMSIDTVQKAVAEHFQMKVADLKSKRRQRAIAMPRQIAMYLSRKLTNASYPDIGEKFGGKDHTTVMHNVKKIEESLDRDLDLKAHIDALERHLEQLQ